MPLSVELRPNPDGSFDEMVATGVEAVHAEMMDDDSLWIAIDGEGGYRWVITVDIDQGKLAVRTWREPTWNEPPP